MEEIKRITRNDFEVETVLCKPVMAHLSTVEEGEPRDSPVWFLHEEGFLWMFGTQKDSFVRRLKKEPRCAVGIVDFDAEEGILKHVGIRGTAQLYRVDRDRLARFVTKYVGSSWNQWFKENIVDPLDVMIQIVPQSIVANDGSFFKTGR